MASSTKEAELKASELLSKLTLKEKFQLLTSPGYLRLYSTKPIKRVGIPAFKMTDGPLGISRLSGGFRKCTRFPATIALASTWDRSLAHRAGAAMASEVRAIGRHMLLAPGINIDRTPLCGRTFEYFSEDPFLTKELAIPFVNGVQGQGIGACIKHFAANNQEIDRRFVSSEVRERPLHEIYLRAFREVVKEADPWAVMACYNKVNGVYGCENRYLLRNILMKRWGYRGFVISDWFASRPIETTDGCINAGLSLEMPVPSRYKMKSLHEAFREGKFTEETLNDLVRRYLRGMYLCGAFEDLKDLPSGALNTAEHQELSRRIGEQGTVLLKNERNILPLHLDELDSIALLGPNLKKKFGRLLYGGSSAVVPPYEITPLQGIREKMGDKVREAADVSDADVAILFVGLNHDKGMDSETYDRLGLDLPKDQIELIKQTAEANSNTIVVIIAGSPIAMTDWSEKVPAIVVPWYSGMEGGRAIANVLFGDSNPSGKLPITFPMKLADSPAHSSGSRRTYPGDDEKKVYYDEGIYVGYRWFDEKNIEPLYPFGYGMSYTDFQYESANASKEIMVGSKDSIAIEVEIENTGERPGSEIVQVYSNDLEASVDRPPKELVGFAKTSLNPGEKGVALVEIKAQDLAYYDANRHEWVIEPGTFELMIGQSSRSIMNRINLEFK